MFLVLICSRLSKLSVSVGTEGGVGREQMSASQGDSGTDLTAPQPRERAAVRLPSLVRQSLEIQASALL